MNGSLETLELKCIGEPSVEWVDDKSFINICELILLFYILLITMIIII